MAALRNGALAEAIEPGRTGILVDTPEALAEALVAAQRLDPQDCRRAAEQRFSDRTLRPELYARVGLPPRVDLKPARASG